MQQSLLRVRGLTAFSDFGLLRSLEEVAMPHIQTVGQLFGMPWGPRGYRHRIV